MTNREFTTKQVTIELPARISDQLEIVARIVHRSPARLAEWFITSEMEQTLDDGRIDAIAPCMIWETEEEAASAADEANQFENMNGYRACKFDSGKWGVTRRDDRIIPFPGAA